MPAGVQLSLFGIGLGRGHLFAPKVLNKHLKQHETTPIPNEAELATRIRQWLDSLKNTTATEKSLKAKFISDVLWSVLGYTAYPVPAGVAATLYAEPPRKVTGISRSPDAVLGQFVDDSEFQFAAAVELKTPGDDLDAPQPSYGNETPVQQGFFYGRHILGIKWVIISDMRTLRLYSVESEGEYEEVDLEECVNAKGQPLDALRELYFLFHHSHLVLGYEKSEIALLYSKSADRRLAIRDGFYSVYYAIRADLYEAIEKASPTLAPAPSRDELLEATQRLLDRLLFIYYCEDHPQQFIRDGTIEGVTKAAASLPGPSPNKIYQFLKSLFKEVDSGSPKASGLGLAAYNGELFKDHRIIDYIDLPDSLDKRVYECPEQDGKARRINGVWGLHVFDFWAELDEHLLGHIFEESLSDLHELGTSEQKSASEKLVEQKRYGIFYTNRILSDFLSTSAIQAILNEVAPVVGSTPTEILVSLEKRLGRLLEMRTADFSCGSGAFLVSVYKEIVQEYWRLRSSVDALQAGLNGGKGASAPLIHLIETSSQASLLRKCVFGADLLPQAVEIAKLALWLRSARKDERVLDLSDNIIYGDSLDVKALFARLGAEPNSFDLVIGNPPWGGEVAPAAYQGALRDLGLPLDGVAWDSWELFVMLGLHALREGGRLALVLPDSFLYSQKARLRQLLFASSTVEKVHNLGPDWFGARVRMGAVIVQARRGPQNLSANMVCLLLAGGLRERAIRGEIPLMQIEAQRAKQIPNSRPARSATTELEVFRGVNDDQIMERMILWSEGLGLLCKRGRGEEVNKAGLYWICPSCLSPTTPGRKRKGRLKDKQCEACGHTLTETSVTTGRVVASGRSGSENTVEFIDGDDINHRYQRITPSKWLQLGLSGWPYKDADLYKPPKILIRQAGVALVATLDETQSYCPQSVYVYRLRAAQAAAGYQHEFVLGALLSRTMTYFVFKRFGEVDPAKAHAKLTHERLAELPIPKVDFSVAAQRRLHGKIVENVKKLLDRRANLGGEEDREIEAALRVLWHITPENGAYINGEFYDLPDSQAIRDLFPTGRPKPVATETS